VPAGQRVREPAAQPVHDARAQQELAHRRRLDAEHLTAQVVGDRVVVACEAREEAVDVGLGAHRQRAEPQPRRPALRSREQTVDLLLVEVEPVAGEECRGLGARERERSRADLAEAALEAQPPERQVGVRPGRDDQAEPAAGLGRERGDHRERRPAQHMQVVEHELDALGRALEGLPHPEGEPARQRTCDRRLGTEVDAPRPQHGGDVSPQACHVEVLGVQ
jgi:hypothetical protein